jgi:hypothetical protein
MCLVAEEVHSNLLQVGPLANPYTKLGILLRWIISVDLAFRPSYSFRREQTIDLVSKFQILEFVKVSKKLIFTF